MHLYDRSCGNESSCWIGFVWFILKPRRHRFSMPPGNSCVDVGNVVVLFWLAPVFSSVKFWCSDLTVNSRHMKEHSSSHTHKHAPSLYFAGLQSFISMREPQLCERLHVRLLPALPSLTISHPGFSFLGIFIHFYIFLYNVCHAHDVMLGMR